MAVAQGITTYAPAATSTAEATSPISTGPVPTAKDSPAGTTIQKIAVGKPSQAIASAPRPARQESGAMWPA